MARENATKKRTAPVSGPLNSALAGTPWLTTGAIPIGALVRSAVFAVDIIGARSVGRTGRRVSALTPTSASQFWVETSDFKTWALILGVTQEGSVVADWSVRLVTDTVGRTCTIRTTQWRRLDGALVNGDQHDLLRDDLLRALALGQVTEANGEAEMTTKSLGQEQPFAGPPPDAFDLAFAFTTALNEADTRNRLGLLGHPVIGGDADSVAWSLGLPANRESDFAARFRPGQISVTAHVSASVPAHRRIAAADLKALIMRMHVCLKSKDENVGYQGPSEWKP
jgi:hypothetical protein